VGRRSILSAGSRFSRSTADARPRPGAWPFRNSRGLFGSPASRDPGDFARAGSIAPPDPSLKPRRPVGWPLRGIGVRRRKFRPWARYRTPGAPGLGRRSCARRAEPRREGAKCGDLGPAGFVARRRSGRGAPIVDQMPGNHSVFCRFSPPPHADFTDLCGCLTGDVHYVIGAVAAPGWCRVFFWSREKRQ